MRAFLLLLVLLAAAAVAGCGGHGAERPAGHTAAPPPAVLASTDIAVIARTDLVAGVPVSGTLTPSVDIRITAPIGDLLDEVLVREGQSVTQGQVLARFRTDVVEPAAASAQAQLQVAAADYERMRNLFAAGAVSQRDVQGAEATWRAAQSGAAMAGRRLDEATVRAPVAGVISQRSVQAGDRLADGDPMFQLVNTAELEFEATVPSQYVPLLRPGSPVRLTVAGFGGANIEGRVGRVNAEADPATRQVKVYVLVPNRGGRLVGGLFATGTVVTQETRGALAAPIPGVRTDGGRSWVMTVRGGTLRPADVTTGVRDENRDLVEVASGLAAGDTVLVGTLEGLTAGQAVQVARAGAGN